MAKPIQKVEYTSVGCLIQAVGVLLPIVLSTFLGLAGGFVGMLMFVALFIVGARTWIKYVCPSCSNPLASKDARLCPTCKVDIG